MGTINEKKCLICHSQSNLHRHHVFQGSLRQRSEEYGMVVWLCFDHHVGDKGVHTHPELDRIVKQYAQRHFEKTHTREDFIEIFHKNYL